MDYTLMCYGKFESCFNCLIKCPDKIACENQKILNRIEKQLEKEKNKDEENEDQ